MLADGRTGGAQASLKRLRDDITVSVFADPQTGTVLATQIAPADPARDI